jgi:hypothetical protein
LSTVNLNLLAIASENEVSAPRTGGGRRDECGGDADANFAASCRL